MDFQALVKKYCIALTGGIASGKSAVAEIIRNCGFVVIDADKLVRKVLELPSMQKKVTDLLGKEVLSSIGELDRKKIAERIFHDPVLKKHYEAIIHPMIQVFMEQELEILGLLKNPKLFFYEAALIIETDTISKFKEVWLVYCSEKNQISRLMTRNKLSEMKARFFIGQQLPTEQKINRAHRVLATDGSFKQVEADVLKLLASIPSI